MATLEFKSRPPCFLSDQHEWSFEIPSTDKNDFVDRNSEDDDDIIPAAPIITIDDHFNGITILRSFKNSSEHKIDCVAISGLGGHAFGSFKERAGTHMWLRDSLCSDLPGARIILYGYDTQLYGSHTFQDLEALASTLRIDLQALATQDSPDIQPQSKPLVFIAHSLGGLVVKEATIQMKRDKNSQTLLESIYGALFFGVPNQGMDISSLVPMVKGQPNQALLHSLGKESQVLRNQCRDFPKAFDYPDSEIVCFYETEMSPTAVYHRTEWKMRGPLSILVDSSSARHGRPWENEAQHCLALKRNHSELVKFSKNDENYDRVLTVLKRMKSSAVSSIPHGRGRLKPNGAVSEEQKRAFLDSLSFKQIDARFLNIEKAHSKTCKWLFEQLEYRNWLDRDLTAEHHGFLWIKGKPGAGKSTMMKHAFNAANEERSPAIVTSFFFNARGSVLEKSTLGMYRSLLFQLLTAIPSLQDNFACTFSSKRKQSEVYEWDIEELQEFLIAAVEDLQQYRLLCFIDALDECKEDEARKLIDFLGDLGETAFLRRTSLNICLSSRHYPHIRIRKGVQLILEGQEGYDRDIATYVESVFNVPSSKKVDNIKAEILKRASGVFLWVVFVVKILNEAYDDGQVHALPKLLRQIPDELDDLFANILTRHTKTRNESILCLQWVLFSQRPLKREELYFAILSGTEPTALGIWDQAEISHQTIDRFILSCSKGLAEVSKAKDRTVQFIHESVRDFLLLRDGLAKLLLFNLSVDIVGLSHERLKECCYQYLVADIYEDLFSSVLPIAKSQEAQKLRNASSAKFPFLEYAAKNIFGHADIAQGRGILQGRFLREFEALSSFSAMQKWIASDSIFQRHQVRRYTPELKLLYYFSEKGLLNLVQVLIDEKPNLDTMGERYGSALQAASASGHASVVRLLIDAGANVNIPGGEYGHALAAAMAYNHASVVALLLEKGAVSIPLRKSLDMPLQWAVRNGHVSIIQQLFSKGYAADINSQDNDGRTPLSQAAGEGQEIIVKLLLNRGADIESRDRDNRSPLLRAVERGHENVVKLLLDKGAETESKGRDGQTPLLWAAKKGREGIVKLLLEKGAETESRDRDGQTPLLYAATNRHETIVKRLLEKGAETESRDRNSQTPLVWAAEKGLEGIVKLLLEKGAEVESRDRNSQTPLVSAAEKGHEGIVKLLLEKGAEVESKDRYSRTPLVSAAEEGHEGIVKLLLEKGAEVESKDEYDRTPLVWAAEKGHEGIVKLLLDKGAKVDSRDGGGRTPLLWAAERGHSEIVKLLLSKEAGVDSRDGDGRTPLLWASKRGHSEIVKLLLSKEAGVDSRDRDGRTPSLWAAEGGHENVFKLLLDKGAETESKDREGQTLLLWAVKKGREGIVKLLLEKGAEVESKDRYGRTSLLLATWGGREGIMKLLLDKGAR